MVIGYFNIIGVTLHEPKTNTPLIVDCNGMLSFPVAFEGMQSVARRNPKVAESCSVMNVLQTPDRSFDQVLRQPFRLAVNKKLLGFLIGKGLDHNF